MANTIAYAELFQKNLDALAVQESVTGWMDANAGQVIYNGGKTVKVPKISMDGLGDYDRNAGYDRGAVTLEYETLTMTQDRGKQFLLDSQDVDESNFVASAGNVMGEFQRVMVVPEIDAYRLSAIATKAISLGTNVAYGYTPDESTILKTLKTAISAAKDAGFVNVPMVIHANSATVLAFELAMASKISVVDFAKGGVVTKVPSLDGIPIVETPAERMYTAITLRTTAAGGGYIKGSTAKNINFMVMPASAPIGVNKQDNMKIFDPNVVQDADAWKLDYRRYHDLWIMDNKAKGIVVNIKDAQA